MNNDIKSFVLKQLEKKQTLPRDADVDSYAYLDSGHVDSMGVMKFVVQLEDAFNIEITPEDMVSERFRTVGGLVALLSEKLR